MKILFPEKINEFEKQHTDSSNALAKGVLLLEMPNGKNIPT